jgi:hypothetical protein
MLSARAGEAGDENICEKICRGKSCEEKKEYCLIGVAGIALD